MFNFFRRKSGKAEVATPEISRQPATVPDRTQSRDSDVTNETAATRKDVVNLLIPEVDYSQKSGVGALLQMMAGKRRKNKKKRSESCRVSPPKETQINLQRSKSDVAPDDVVPKNTGEDQTHERDDPAEFVKALVLQKYSKPADRHVSLVYVNPPDDEKRHAEALLREIARSIDCTIDDINKQMGTVDSKTERKSEPVYETIEDNNKTEIDSYKNDLKNELEQLLQVETKEIREESPAQIKKSNLKPPKSDTEGCSDDDRSDCGKKRVTFRKHIIFDDGEQQTDDEVDSSFESLTSEEEEEEYLEDSLPDNDELLGYVVSDDNRTLINVTDDNVSVKIDDDSLKRISSDNSDSGFIDSEKNESGDDTTCAKSIEAEESGQSESEVSESETEEEIIEEIEEVEEIEEEETEEEEEFENCPDAKDDKKTLVSQENKFQSQVTALTELADSRCGEAEKTREVIAQYRKEIEAKDQEIEQLKCELAAAYKESELVRQRSRSLEEEVEAARNCSAGLADQLQRKNDECLRQLRAELEDAHNRRVELESRVQALERDRDRLQQEKLVQEQKAQEALTAAEENTTKWRTAHEAARNQAAARAERMLADCEWKMRELERKARDKEKENKALIQTVEQLKSAPPSPTHVAELQQLRGLASEQQRSVQALSLQLQRVETREEALKLEVHRLKELLDKEARIAKEKEERHMQTIDRLEKRHTETIDTLKAEHATSAANNRAALERAHAERTRAALAQLRAEAEQEGRNADRKLREVTTRFENLKEVLASKETQFEHSLAEAHSKADWDIMQLRHLLDRADITYANNVDQMTERFDNEKERLLEEWSQKVQEVEEEAANAADEAKKLLESTRQKLIAERVEQINKLKEQHKQEMEDQWEQFMSDKETCLERMKAECRQEGEEERVKREKELLEEIAELKSQVHSKSADFDHLASEAAACGRTLAVTEQELREALAREKELREKRSEDLTKMKQAERATKDQVEHLTRKCACLRKLFDDMRARLAAGEQESRSRDKELIHLRAEVARLTKILVEQSSPKLGARTRADGCEQLADAEPRRKGM